MVILNGDNFKPYKMAKWIDNNYPDKYLNFGGMTGNERLWVSGLFERI